MIVHGPFHKHCQKVLLLKRNFQVGFLTRRLKILVLTHLPASSRPETGTLRVPPRQRGGKRPGGKKNKSLKVGQVEVVMPALEQEASWTCPHILETSDSSGALLRGGSPSLVSKD